MTSPTLTFIGTVGNSMLSIADRQRTESQHQKRSSAANTSWCNPPLMNYDRNTSYRLAVLPSSLFIAGCFPTAVSGVGAVY